MGRLKRSSTRWNEIPADVGSEFTVLVQSSFRHPTAAVLRVFEFERLPRDVQGAEGVDHHGEFFGPLLADGRLRPAGMRAVGDAGGVHGQRAIGDALAAHEFVVGVEQHFVAHHVRVVVRCGDGVRVEVEQPRDERAHHEAVGRERLMHRRGLMQRPGDRLEVVNRKRERIIAAVPADDVQRVMVQRDFGEQIPLLDDDAELAAFVVGLQFRRPADVPLAVRGMLHQLAFLRQVTIREPHPRRRFEDQQTARFVRNDESMEDASRHNNVIPGPIRQHTEFRFQPAAPFADVDDFIPLPVAVEMLVGLRRADERDDNVAIEQHRRAVQRRAFGFGNLAQMKVPHPQRGIGFFFERYGPQRLRGEHPRRRMHVIQQ